MKQSQLHRIFLLFSKSICVHKSTFYTINFKELFRLLHNRCQEGIEIIPPNRNTSTRSIPMRIILENVRFHHADKQ